MSEGLESWRGQPVNSLTHQPITPKVLPLLRSLPVYQHKNEIITVLRERQVVIVAGETGSGKSISLPFICREAGYGVDRRIAVTQPRRIAAVSLAAYAAVCSATPPGELVGYRVRFRHSVRPSTRIVYMTDGILSASLPGNRRLTSYDTVIIDEAHERSLTIDFLLGYMRTLLPLRPDLRLVISSATADTRLFSRMFNHAPVITAPGRRYTVDLRYRPVIALWKGVGIDSFVEGALRAVEEVCSETEEGDILVFLPTVDDVMETVTRLRHRLTGRNVTVLPLHSRMSMRQQKEVFTSANGRKVVVATNIAETSLTVPGIRFVVDTGLARILRYEPGAGIARMPVERVSRASADQRAGRCGRERDGVCIRLYSGQDYCSQPRFTPPEIRRTGCAGLLLKMHSMHLGDPARFPFPQRPAPASVAEGYRLLMDIGALDAKKRLTPDGKAMARFPLDPPVACMLIKAKSFGVLPEVAVIAAALSAQEPLSPQEGDMRRFPGELRYSGSDFLTYLNVWNRLRKECLRSDRLVWRRLRSFGKRYGFQPMRIREWVAAFDHIRRICSDLPGYAFGPSAVPAVRTVRADAIHKCLLAGLVHGIAVHTGNGVYEGVGVREIRIASLSVTFRKRLPWLLFHGIVETGRVYGARAAAVNPKWVEELFQKQCTYRHEDPAYHPVSGKVLIREEVLFRSLTLIKNRSVDCAAVDRELAGEVFVREALAGGLIGERYRFIEHYRSVRETIATAERKLRRPLYAGDEKLVAWYAERVTGVTSRSGFNALLRHRGGDTFLHIPPGDLMTEPLPPAMDTYADTVTVGSFRLPVKWRYNEESPEDGATVTVPQRLVQVLPWYYWEWCIPALLRMRAEALVGRLTGALIVQSIDPADAADALDAMPPVPDRSYTDAVAELFERRFALPGNTVRAVCGGLPEHLWLRVVVTDEKGVGIDRLRPPFTKGITAGTGQDRVAAVLFTLVDGIRRNAPADWDAARLLEPVACGGAGQEVPCIVYPTLCYGERGMAVEVFTCRNTAMTVHADALLRACAERCTEEMAWAVETIRLPESLLRSTGIARERLHDAVVRLFERYVGQFPEELPRTTAAFAAMVEVARERIANGASTIIALFGDVFFAIDRCDTVCRKRRHRYSGSSYAPLHRELAEALDRYRGAIFSPHVGIAYLLHLPEWLDAFPHRSAAAFLDTAKYRTLMREVYSGGEVINECKESAVYPLVTARERLRLSMERYIVGQFSGGGGKREREVTAADLTMQREVLEMLIAGEE